MKAIPEQLRAYFPKAINADRPWWNREEVPMGFFVGTRWSRPDGYETTDIEDRESIDKANPLPPPPILVGQVWACPMVARPDTVVVVQLHRVVLHADRRDAAFGPNDNFFATAPDLLANGFLLSCPYGYAPWSGPEVP